MDPDTLTRLLTRNKCSLTKTARALGVTPQRVEQMVREQGLVITKRVERLEDVSRGTRTKKRRPADRVEK